MQKSRITYSILFLILLLTEIFIALFVNDSFIRPFAGDILVTILLCCFVRIFKPDGIKLLPLYIFLFSVCVEILQYFDYVKLLSLENNRFFTVLLGTSFSWYDIICYAVGCAVFFAVEGAIKGNVRKSEYKDFQGVLVKKRNEHRKATLCTNPTKEKQTH